MKITLKRALVYKIGIIIFFLSTLLVFFFVNPTYAIVIVVASLVLTYRIYWTVDYTVYGPLHWSLVNNLEELYDYCMYKNLEESDFYQEKFRKKASLLIKRNPTIFNLLYSVYFIKGSPYQELRTKLDTLLENDFLGKINSLQIVMLSRVREEPNKVLQILKDYELNNKNKTS